MSKGRMARILNSRFGFSINLDGNVGPKGGNERSDVGIVQFALRLLTDGQLTPFGREVAALVAPSGFGTIAVDGFFGRQTKAFIEAYQTVRVRLPGPVQMRCQDRMATSITSEPAPGILGSDVRGAGLEDVISRVRSDGRAPALLKPFFLTDA